MQRVRLNFFVQQLRKMRQDLSFKEAPTCENSYKISPVTPTSNICFERNVFTIFSVHKRHIEVNSGQTGSVVGVESGGL